MNSNYRDLAFLLSLGSLPLACTEKDPADTTDTTDTGSAPLTDPGPMTETGTDPGPTDPGPTDPGTTDTGTTADNTTGAAVDVCQAYADFYVGCFPEAAMYAAMLVSYCKSYIADGMAADGPACVAAIESYFACLSALSCMDVTDDDSDECLAESDAIDAACPNLGEDPFETDTSGEESVGDDSDDSGPLTDNASETG